MVFPHQTPPRSITVDAVPNSLDNQEEFESDDDNNQNSSPSLWPVRPVVVLNWDQVSCVFENLLFFFWI